MSIGPIDLTALTLEIRQWLKTAFMSKTASQAILDKCIAVGMSEEHGYNLTPLRQMFISMGKAGYDRLAAMKYILAAFGAEVSVTPQGRMLDEASCAIEWHNDSKSFRRRYLKENGVTVKDDDGKAIRLPMPEENAVYGEKWWQFSAKNPPKPYDFEKSVKSFVRNAEKHQHLFTPEQRKAYKGVAEVLMASGIQMS